MTGILRPSSFQHEPEPAATKWSEYQEAIFSFMEESTGSANVIAVAGSGKTTTIKEAARRLPTSGLSILFVAFNKSIAEELKRDLPAHIRAQTLNSLGYGAWLRHIGKKFNEIQLNGNKTRDQVKHVVPEREHDLFLRGMPRLIGLMKANGLVPSAAEDICPYGLIADDDDVWIDAIERFGIDVAFDTESLVYLSKFIGYARETLNLSIATAREVIDFDDQLYMPVVTGARFWENDVIFADEAQDLNVIQRVMLERALKPGGRGRLIAVGDPNQAIYGFRGADETSMERIKQHFKSVDLPLTISYRCPKAVVSEAQRWVTHIQSAPTARDGEVKTLGKYDVSVFTPEDAIICRNTRPLIDQAFKIIREGMPCKVRGRDIGQGLVALIRKFKDVTSIDNLMERMNKYVAFKCDQWTKQGKEDLAQKLADQHETLVVFADQLDHTRPVEDLIHSIERLFTDNGPTMLTLSTIHKAKGLEWENVFILDPDLMPSKYARTDAAKQQERNLQYVAVTRAKNRVIYIRSDDFKSKKEKKEGKEVSGQ